MKNNFSKFLLVISSLFLIIIPSCKKDPPKVIPKVSTTTLTNITSTNASSGGTITIDGGAPVTARGVCWNTTQNPTISDFKTNNGTGTGTFISAITGLTPGATYYVRAYATNSVGTAYGTQVSFSTTAILPTITTTSLSAITTTTATGGGNIISDGGAAISARGVCWNTSQYPTILNSKTNDGTSAGTFSSSITGLTPGSTYYVRAYSTNSIGTAYGNQVTATTLANLPTISTNAISSISATTAVGGGNISNDGGAEVTARGVCWGTSPNPTIANNKTTDGTGTGSFSSSITGLTLGVTYYVRAYATNSAGTAYGSEVTFKTVVLTVTDIDGNVYSTVNLGNQIWMAENLKTTRFRNGSLIGTTTNELFLDIPHLYTPVFQWPCSGVEAYVSTYGRLYTLYAASDSRGVCPYGWHLPSNYEWTTMVEYINSHYSNGAKAMASKTGVWANSTVSGAVGNIQTGNNACGFNAVPSGYMVFDWWFGFEGEFWNTGYKTIWWTRNSYNDTDGYCWRMQFDENVVTSVRFSMRNGLSVRCVKD